jgi:hypothetical protein
MKATALVLVMAPFVVFAQATPAAKPAAKPAPMAHDMSTMGGDTARKHDMTGMKMDSGMKGDMSGMHGGMMAGGTMKGGTMKGGTMKGGMMKGGMMGGMMQGEMKSGWGELDAFHSMLMATWHPAEKDSLALARSLAATLSAAADAWAKSKGPAACDNAALRQELPAIVANTKAFASVATNPAKDADVKAALKKVHDGFEKTAEPCMMAGMKGMPGMGGMMNRPGEDSMMKRVPAKDSAKKPMGGMDHLAMHNAPAKKP